MRTKASGFTVIEIVLASSLSLVIFGALVRTTSRAQGLFAWIQVQSDLESDMARAMQRVDSELRMASVTSLAPDLTTPVGADRVWGSDLTFTGTNAAGQLETKRLTWQMDADELLNGIDDDGDGLVDEGRIVFLREEGSPDQSSSVLISGVPNLQDGETNDGTDENGNQMIDESGFAVSVEGSVVTLQLTAQRRCSGETLTRMQELQIRLRNQ